MSLSKDDIIVKQTKEIYEFSSENQYFFDTTVLRNNIKFHYLNNNIDFEE